MYTKNITILYNTGETWHGTSIFGLICYIAHSNTCNNTP